MTNFNDLCLDCFEERQGKNPCPSCGASVRKPAGNGIALQPGTILYGKYLVGKLLGQGGFGITYLGFDLNLKSKIAIKEYFLNGFVTRKGGKVIPLNRQYLETFREGVELFYHEAESLARFRSNLVIVNVYDFFRENGTAYIVMEYITGTSLSAYLSRRNGKLDYTETLKILTPIMDALATLHEVNLLHRDVSPDNILLAADGRIRLIDFGAALPAIKENRENLPTILKVGYAPIEQYTGTGKQGPWTDLYALAATFYLCLTGETVPESTDRMTVDSLESPAEKGVTLPAPANLAIIKTLSVQPETRTRSISEFREALERPDPQSEAQKRQPVAAKLPKQPEASGKSSEKKSGAKKRPHKNFLRNRGVRFGIFCSIYLALANGIHVLIGNPPGFVLFPIFPKLAPIVTAQASQTNDRSTPFYEVETATEQLNMATRNIDEFPETTGISPFATPDLGTAAGSTRESNSETVSPNDIEIAEPNKTGTTLSTSVPTEPAEPTLAATPRPAPNRVREIDKMTEVNIVSGSNNFWIDIREVSVQQFINYSVQTGKIGGKASNKANNSPTNPITNISRSEAADYCRWSGGRLPTLTEWLTAANPDPEIDFINGDFEPIVNLNEINCEGPRVNSVDNYQFPANANGVHDLYGNVWEWVNGAPDAAVVDKLNSETDLRFLIVGGSWKSECDSIQNPAGLIETGSGRDDVGFRCVRDD